MKVMNILKVGLMVSAAGFFAGCSDSKSDPATESKSDLNPPGTLWTVTQNAKIELRWTAGNVEEDFKGYYVFAVEKSKYTDAMKPMFPTGVNVALSGVPRCVTNTAFFQAFGLPESKKDCEDDTAVAPAAAKTLTSGSMLADAPAATGDTAAAEKLTGFVKCAESTAAEPSLVVAPPAVKTQKCTVTALADATALKNGTTYGFLVVAVRKDDLTGVSWSSNLVWDTPSNDAVPVAPYKLNNGKFIAIELDVTKATGTVKAAADCDAATDSAELCGVISASNGMLTTKPTIFLSRAAASGGGSSLQRLYVSASKDPGDLKIQARGPQTWDPLTATKVERIPGDSAATVYPDPGTKYVVYNNQVFDFQATVSGSAYYGKVVVEDVAYADPTTPGATNTSEATVNVAVIMQPSAGVTDYFTTASLLH